MIEETFSGKLSPDWLERKNFPTEFLLLGVERSRSLRLFAEFALAMNFFNGNYPHGSEQESFEEDLLRLTPKG